METIPKSFELDFNGGKIKVAEHKIAGQIVFRIVFPDRRTPLVINRAEHFDAHSFWTSIPEGRQKEAEEIGALISNYLNANE